MPILVILIIFSFSFYIFYKIKYVRSKHPAEKKWISSKSSIALGAFVAFFGLNQLFTHSTKVSIIIGIIFVLLGLFNVYGGIKSYKFYLPFAVKEAEELRKQS